MNPPVITIGLPLIPVTTNALDLLDSRRFHVIGPDGQGVLAALEDLQPQAFSGVSHNVAVHEPRAWVVGAEGDDGESAVGNHDYVSPRWVGGVEDRLLASSELFARDVEYDKVVAVEMDLEIVRGERINRTVR